MTREVLPGIFKIEVPLPNNPLRILNSYLIKGEKRHLLIDTGFHRSECKEALLAGIEQAGVRLADLDFFITHVHGDHSGLVYELASEEAAVYCSKIDADILKATMTEEFWRQADDLYSQNGFPQTRDIPAGSRIQGYISGSALKFSFVEEGRLLEIGPYRLTCIMTPGHSPGHVCLYEAGKKLFFSGDHILGDISPNITAWSGMPDSLGQYLQSLDRVDKLEIDVVLSGHRNLLYDHHVRIAEIKHHHQVRLAEILSILEKSPMNAYQVAGFMTWDLPYASWEQFPIFQRWFATGETIAHLEHLVVLNQVYKISQGEFVNYILAT